MKIKVDIFDRPDQGISFPGGKQLITGTIWTLYERGDYMFVRITSPMADASKLEAILGINQRRIKVFVDPPWLGQKMFFSAWNLLFQIAFRASLDPSKEQLVRGLGLVVNRQGVLVNVSSGNDRKVIMSGLSNRFPTIGSSRLLLRASDNKMYLYSTPWSSGDQCANVTVSQAIVFTPEVKKGEIVLTGSDISKHFGLKQGEGSFRAQGDIPPVVENLPVTALPISSTEKMAAEIIRLTETASISNV